MKHIYVEHNLLSGPCSLVPKLWHKELNLSKLGPEDRVRLLRYAVDRYGSDRVLEVLGVSRITLWKFLNGRSPGG